MADRTTEEAKRQRAIDGLETERREQEAAAGSGVSGGVAPATPSNTSSIAPKNPDNRGSIAP
jgi:hypothetical protein